MFLASVFLIFKLCRRQTQQSPLWDLTSGSGDDFIAIAFVGWKSVWLMFERPRGVSPWGETSLLLAGGPPKHKHYIAFPLESGQLSCVNFSGHPVAQTLFEGVCEGVLDEINIWVGRLIDQSPRPVVMGCIPSVKSLKRIEKPALKGVSRNSSCPTVSELGHCSFSAFEPEMRHRLFLRPDSYGLQTGTHSICSPGSPACWSWDFSASITIWANALQ